MSGSEKSTLREGLIALSSRAFHSTVQWGKYQANFTRNPFREFENLKSVLERLTSVIDYACSAGPEYTVLLAQLCEAKFINNEILQILEGAQILGNPYFTTVITQAFTTSKHDVGQVICGIRQLLPALGDRSVVGLREQMQPYTIDLISNYVRGVQHTLCMQVGAGTEWFDTAINFVLFTQEMQEHSWLLTELDQIVQQCIACAPPLMTLGTLHDIRDSVRSTTASTPSPLRSQIDEYCKARLIPGYPVELDIHLLVEALINLWQQHLVKDRRELALLIAEFPNTGYQFRSDCLTDIMTFNDTLVINTLKALKFHDENLNYGCIALIVLLASEKTMVILERWRKVLSFVVEIHHEKLLRHAVTHLTIDDWFELLRSIREVYKGTEAITERRYPRLLSLELHTWSQEIGDHLPILRRLENVLKRGPAMHVLLSGSAPSKNHQLLQVLGHYSKSRSRKRATVMRKIMTQLHSENIDEIANAISAVSEARSPVAETCLLIIDSRGQVHPELAEVVLAISLRAEEFPESDRLALRKVASLFGTSLDPEGYPSGAALKEAAKNSHKKHLELIAEAQRLENLRLSLQAVAPERVSRLLVKLHIEAPSVVDDALASLPSSLGSLVEKVSKDELELQFPATGLTRLQRDAIGAGNAEGFLIRLTLRHDGVPIKLCVHLSGESSDQTNSKTYSIKKGHTPWRVFEKSNRPPHEQYCHGRPNLGAYQVSRILWHHFRYSFKSLEQTHAHMTSKLSKFGQGCAVCGLGQRRLRRATICSSPSCHGTFLKASTEIQLSEVWQDPSVIDLLLSMIHATAATEKLNLLIDCHCPVKNTPDAIASMVTTMFDGLPTIPILAIYLKDCLDKHGDRFRLIKALSGLCTPTHKPEILAKTLVWVCSSYRGFLVSATGPQRIPSFGKNQVLLANAAPELEIAFSRHMLTPQSESQILFHGTSLDRLHPILCQGLRVQSGTGLQQHGAAYGAGIYLADEPKVAWGYATVSPGGWKLSKLKDIKLLLGCELAGSKPQAVYPGIYVITDATLLAVRYVFLLGSNAMMPAAKDVRLPMGSVFQSLRNNTL